MKSIRVGLFALAVLGAVLGARAATATINIGTDTYTLDTGHSGGTCHVKDLADDGSDVDCFDDDGHRAYANSRKGCLATALGGSCYRKKPEKLRSFISATCGTTVFVIGTENARTSCHVDYDYAGHAKGAVCDDKRDSQVALDCSKNRGEGGCMSSSGSGACLME